MRRTTKILACLLVMCMLIAALPMGSLFASAETMSAEPSKNSTPGANHINNYGKLLLTVGATVKPVYKQNANSFTLDLSKAGYTSSGLADQSEQHINLISDGVFGYNDTWTLEYDFVASDFYVNDKNQKDYRIGFNVGKLKLNNVIYELRVMLQGDTLLVSVPNAGKTGYTWKTVSSNLNGVMWTTGNKMHVKYIVNGGKSVIFSLSNGTNEYTYTYDFTAEFGEGYTISTNLTTLSYKKAKFAVTNLYLYGPISNVTAPTAENNLVLTKGKWVSGYTGKVYPFTATKDSFYINTTVAGQVASGLTAYTTSFDICPFGTGNTAYNFDATKSYVISANVARANSTNTHPDTGKSVVSRLFYYFGKYNDKDLMIYFDKNGYHWCKEGYKTYTTSPLLSNVPLNEYARITAYVSPFEIEIYVNGEFLTSMALEDPSLLTYDFKFRSAGTEAWFKDVAIWENTANGDKYYDVLSSQYFEFTAPGVRTDLDLTALKVALDAYKAGSANTTLTPFANTFSGATKTVVNNLVLDGTTLVGTTASKTFEHNTSVSNDWKYGNIALFNGTSPFTPESDFVVEADYIVRDWWYNTRIGFSLNNVGAGDVYIHGNIPYVNGTVYNGTVGGTKPTIKNVANRWHVKFIVKGGESLRTVITDSNTGALYYDYTAPWSSLKADSVNKENYNPVLYFTCGNFDIKNLYVGYDVTAAKDALSATVTEYAAKDTNGFTADSVKNFTDALAAANTILGAYTKYSNAEINAAAAAVVSAFGALEEATIKVPVGDIEIDIAPDAQLPVNTKPEGTTKFILGWKNPDGTAYEGDTYVEGLVADYVETLMMTVKYQLGTSGNAIRYIASVDETERYAKVGWAFSLTNANPEIDGENVVVRDSSLVYNSVLANGTEKTAADIYGGADYAQYLYVFEITDIPEAAADSIIYVRPYVEMNDGTIVYGEVSTQSLAGLKTR